MPITLPTTDPVNDYCPSLSNGRVLLVSNSDVDWSYRLTERYRRRKRIPAANHLTFALGAAGITSGYDAGSNAALMTAVIDPLVTAMDAIGAQAIVFGPGTPLHCYIYNEWVDTTTQNSGVKGYVPLPLLFACARQVQTAHGLFSGQGLAHSSGFPVQVNVSGMNYIAYSIGGGFTETRTGLVAYTVATTNSTYSDLYTGLDGTHALPKTTTMDEVGKTTNRAIPFGRIGIGWGQDAYRTGVDDLTGLWETEQTAWAAMERGLRYSESLSPANRYQLRTHVRLINDSNITSYRDLGYLLNQMAGWGYQTSYHWRDTAHSDLASLLPTSGNAYSRADLDSGKVRDFPYHLMMGVGENTEMIQPPWKDAWLPDGGGSVTMGPSEGWQYAVQGMFRGGASGASNLAHIGVGYYTAFWAILTLLLRGMTWAQALYYASPASFIYGLASGDPLARPFPR